MKPYNKSIEIFGISGSGKSYARKKILKILSSYGYKIFDTRELIIKFLDKFTELTFKEKLQILYFKVLLIFNIKTTLWNYRLNKICQRFLKKNKMKLKKLIYLKKLILTKKKDYNFKQYDIWFNELFIAQLIFDKIRYKKNIIFFPDEGYIQKIFILAYNSEKINSKKINNYLKNIKTNILVINLISSLRKIKQVISNRKSNKIGWIANSKQINKMKLIEKMINKNNKKYINIFYLKNNYNIKKQILKILKNLN